MRPLTIYIDGYFDANEGKILEKVKFNAKTFKEVMSGFARLGYRYEGCWYWTNKDINGFCWDEFQDVFSKIADIQEKFFDECQFDSSVVNVWCGRDKNGKERTAADCPGMCSANGDEKVIKFKDKDKKGHTRTYYCFWNPSQKYYYIINIERNSGFIGGWHDFIPAFEGWITIKTRSVSDIETEYAKIAEETRKKEEQRQKEYEEQLAKEKELEDLKKKYEDFKEAVKKHYDSHADDFKKVEWEDLPKEARNNFSEQCDMKDTIEDYRNAVEKHNFFRYYIRTGSDPGYNYYDVLVANRDFSECYLYETSIRNKWSLD